MTIIITVSAQFLNLTEALRWMHHTTSLQVIILIKFLWFLVKINEQLTPNSHHRLLAYKFSNKAFGNNNNNNNTELYCFAFAKYSCEPKLVYGNHIILSREGNQQGDPLSSHQVTHQVRSHLSTKEEYDHRGSRRQSMFVS